MDRIDLMVNSSPSQRSQSVTAVVARGSGVPAQSEAALHVVPTRPDAGRFRNPLRGELRAMASHRLFVVGLVLKLLAGLLFGSHVATRWFAPFVAFFVKSHFADPYAAFVAQGEPLAFPYGPGMLAILTPPWLISLVVPVSPSGFFGLLLLRLPLLAADAMVCFLILRWLRSQATEVLAVYWLNPIVFYATYVHGQLDLIPTALLCLTLQLVFVRRTMAAAMLLGFAIATKAHLLIAAPFVAVFLLHSRTSRTEWLRFLLLTMGTAGLLLLIPAQSAAFRTMVFGSSEALKLWSVSLAYGSGGLLLYLAPAALLIALLRFVSYRKVSQELTLTYLGAVYAGLVALVPPQPGWFVWSVPFCSYMYAQFARRGRLAMAGLSVAYLAYFFVADPVLMFESLEPLLGTGSAEAVVSTLRQHVPWLIGRQTVNIVWTTLFGTAILTAIELYQRGVQASASYRMRDENFMIGIGGDSGAGKHTIGADLARLLGRRLTLLNGDDDHRWERGDSMWTHYTHLDPRGNHLAAQMESLISLRNNRQVRRRHYDHSTGRFTEPLLVSPNDFMCIVGLHPFYLPSQRQVFHLRIFVNPAEELRQNWKVARDMSRRGYSKEQVLEQIERRRPDSDKYVMPQMKHADVVVRHLPLGPDENPRNDEESTQTELAVELEMSSALEPLQLVDALEGIPTLHVTWQPDEALTRDRLLIKGTVTADELSALAESTIPNADQILVEPGFEPGARGVVQLALLYAMSVRLRSAMT